MNMDREQTHVEFFGLPGSGKTTIARTLFPLLEAHDPGTIFGPIITADHKSWVPRTAARLLLIVRGFPWRRADWHALHAIATTGQRTHLDKAKTLFNYVTVASLYRLIKLRSSSAVVDQGILQAIWSTHFLAEDLSFEQRWAHLLFCEAGTAKHYVCVEAPVSVCVERLGARREKHSRMQSDALLHDSAIWERAENVRTMVLGELIASFRERGPSPRIVVVDGTGDPAEIAAGIVAKICAGSTARLPIRAVEIPTR